jgi:hypothetical protein
MSLKAAKFPVGPTHLPLVGSKMADVVTSSVCSSQFLMNSESGNDVNTCQMCKNYEALLKEALEELNSIQTINRLLQKEQQVCAVPTDTWGLNNSDPTSCNN